jgi:hypothetical protein
MASHRFKPIMPDEFVPIADVKPLQETAEVIPLATHEDILPITPPVATQTEDIERITDLLATLMIRHKIKKIEVMSESGRVYADLADNSVWVFRNNALQEIRYPA